MERKIELVLRLIGMAAFGLMGLRLGEIVTLPGGISIPQLPYVLALAGVALGLWVTPWLTTKPFSWLRGKIRQMPVQTLVAASIGLILGLVISAFLAFPLSFLPSPFGKILPIAASLLLAYLGMITMVLRQRELLGIFRGRLRKGKLNGEDKYVLLDTSVIIDGRIADISRTGFIEGTMLVPRFVLAELQRIADSPDTLRRNRGRRGLDMLNKLQKESIVPIRITDVDVEGIREVDGKLVQLGKDLHCSIITNDYNLKRVAELQGVKVLNINELANAVRAVVLPGESLKLRIIQEGKELGQGVGYLDDGTMVVVENGRKYINNTIEVTVTRVLQTVAGRMIFAQPAVKGARF